MELKNCLPGEIRTDQWYGFRRYHFQLSGHDAWIVEPENPAHGSPWAWCLEWPQAFVERIGVIGLVKNGFYYAYVGITGTYASEAGLAILEQLYESMQEIGLNKKAAMIGISVGGYYAYRYAAVHPDHVAVIYGDAPLCNVLTYIKMPDQWQTIKESYLLENDEELLLWPGNPIDNLAPLAEQRIPILHIIGETDEVVPVGLNSDIVERRYRQLGGNITVIRRPYTGHHPHGHDDPCIAINFITTHYLCTSERL